MNNWQTTIAGIVGALANIVAAYGFEVDAKTQGAIVSLTLFVIGLLAKDRNVTGGTKPATNEAKERISK